MIAYKGLETDLTCRGYQFFVDRTNVTEKANCAQNGFHCAEDPLDCLSYYSNWRNSVYYVVRAEGDIDEDGTDSKISCTCMTLLKKLSMQDLLLHALAYMVRYPGREWNRRVLRETGTGEDGFAIVRGKNPRASGQMGDILALAKEAPDAHGIQEVALFVVDGKTYLPGVWYGIKGKSMEQEAA